VSTIKKQNWITTNELLEATKTLQMVNYFMCLAEKDSYHWKWVLIALHNTLQNFMVCALRGKDGLNLLKDSVVKKWVADGKKGSPYPNEAMDTFLNLYKKIKSNRMLINSNSKVYQPRGQQDRSIRKLNLLRNNFIHFKPKSWHLEINGLPVLVADTVDIIKFLAFTSGNIKLSKETKAEITKASEEVLNQLKRLEAISFN